MVIMEPNRNVTTVSYPENEPLEISEFIVNVAIRSLTEREFPFVRVVIEQVSGYVGKPQPGSRMFNFGRNYGFYRGCLVAHGFTEVTKLHPIKLRNKLVFITVSPQSWQRGVGIQPRIKKPVKETDSQWKGRLKLYAERLYPSLKLSTGNADAVLITDYCKQMFCQ